MTSKANENVKRPMMSNFLARRSMKIFAALITAGLVTGLATPAFASSAPGTAVSFTVSPAPVTRKPGQVAGPAIRRFQPPRIPFV